MISRQFILAGSWNLLWGTCYKIPDEVRGTSLLIFAGQTKEVRGTSNLAFSSTPLDFRFAFPPFLALLLVVHSPLTTVQPFSYAIFCILWLCSHKHLMRSHVSFNKCHRLPINSRTATADEYHRLPIASRIHLARRMPLPDNSVMNCHVRRMPSPANNLTNYHA